ncbi:hypothetical protein [Bradyrhizobium sp. RT4b]|uniref:hypothetical protein n=1 Tax=Bradyrhizobium sp. RT4b TaxID=3156379 RepID=UPI00339207C5
MAAPSQADWRRALVESFPELFAPVGEPPTAPGRPCCGDGWRDLLQRACMRIRVAIADDGGRFRIDQVKEKYGTLRLSGSLSPEAAARVEEAVDLAEARSAVTCEVCGGAGVLRAGGWLATRCAAHAEGRPAIEFDEGFEVLHVERRLVGDRVVVRYRFYDRAGDRFVEVGRGRGKKKE